MALLTLRDIRVAFGGPTRIVELDRGRLRETLDLLEDLLLEYTGTLLLVSHDRAFLNNVVTSTLVIDESGTVSEYVGGYDDWLKQREVAVPPKGERHLPRGKNRVRSVKGRAS